MISAPIIVASAVDKGYLPFALVVAASIARAALPGRPIEYHVLYDGPDHWALGRLQHFRRGEVTVTVHRVPNPWAYLGTINGFPPSTFFRAAIPTVLAGYGRVIYLDCDLIVEADLGELFDSDLAGAPFGATTCVLTVTSALSKGLFFSAGRWVPTDEYMRAELGLATRDQQLGYTQAGVQLYDLEQMRAIDFAGQLTAVVNEMGDRLALCDQCAVNKLFAGRIAPIDPIWNIAPFALDAANESRVPPEMLPIMRRQRARQGIVHFGGLKPWWDLSMTASWRWWRNALASDAALFAVRHGARQQINRLMEAAARRYPRQYDAVRQLFRRLRPKAAMR